MLIKNKVKKEYGKVMFAEKIKLSKTHNNIDLEEINAKDFDKNLLNYKKHFLCITRSHIVFLASDPKVKNNNNIQKDYKKDYKIENIGDVEIFYDVRTFTTTQIETKTSYRKITDQYGHSHTEEIKEDVPVERTNTAYNILYGIIYFKNTLVKQVCFDFSQTNKNYYLAQKVIKICTKLNIPAKLLEAKE